MKKILSLILTFALSSLAFGQSVLEVPATDDDGNPIINAIIKYVVADTNDAGEQLHDVYKLERGKTYFYNQSPVFNNPITLIADEPGTTDDTKPPKIILTTDDAGEVPYEYCLTTFADLTVKNIAFTTITIDGDYSWANAILLQSDNLRIELENCYFELIGFGMIEASVDNTVFILDKCHVRNGTVLPDGDEWCAFFLEIDTGTADSVIIRNSTFFNVQGAVVNIEAQNPIKYFEFDHNTVVNVVKGFTTQIHAHLNSIFTNNIFYNVSTHGALIADVPNEVDQVFSGIISADTLISNVPNAPDSLKFIMEEKDRSLIIRNNVYFYSQGVQDYFSEFESSVEAPSFLDSRAQILFDNDDEWPNFIEENNVNADPGFTNFGGTDGMVAQLRNHRTNGVFGFWGWDPDSTDYPEYHWAYLQWPLPEDFTYSNSFTSTDGFHVGSLKWYPDELAQYESNLTGVDDEDGYSIPQDFALEQNYPNPFNPSTKVNFNLAQSGAVKLSIYNTLGQKVKDVINNQEMNAGSHHVNIDMSGESSGVYLLILKQQNNVQARKMILMK
ncbi:MAG: T9SS type A sorting domain-containing protein [Ignavibacteria bacterium]|jgi:hypothetical protein